MTDPLNTDDDWAELARELERDKPPAPEPAEIVESPGDSRAEEAEGEGEEFEDAEDGAPGDATAEGDPGTGRKRRRRRRRRRKGTGPAEGAVAGAPADVEDEGDAEVEASAEAEDEPVAEAIVAESDDYEAEEQDAEPVLLGTEEDTANEVLRDLITTWNVPSWDEIVSGLYRPN